MSTKMKWIVFLGILSIISNFEIKACFPNTRYANLVRPVMKKSILFLAKQKLMIWDFLLDVKANASDNITLKFITLRKNHIKLHQYNKYNRSNEGFKKALLAFHNTHANLTFQIRQAVKRGFELFEPLEDAVEKFIENIKQCILQYESSHYTLLFSECKLNSFCEGETWLEEMSRDSCMGLGSPEKTYIELEKNITSQVLLIKESVTNELKKVAPPNSI